MLVYAFGDCFDVSDFMPSPAPYELSPLPKMLLILFTMYVPDSVQRLNPSTVTFVAYVKSLAIKYRGGRLAPSATDPESGVVRPTGVVNSSERLIRKVLENQVAKRNRSSVRLDSVLPVLVDVESVQGCLGTEVLKGNVRNISRPSRISLDKRDVIALDDAYVASMLQPVSYTNEADDKALTILAIDADTFRLPIEIPDPAWLHTRFSTRA